MRERRRRVHVVREGGSRYVGSDLHPKVLPHLVPQEIRQVNQSANHQCSSLLVDKSCLYVYVIKREARGREGERVNVPYKA